MCFPPSSDLSETEGTGDDNLEEKKTILCKVSLFLHFIPFLFVLHSPRGSQLYWGRGMLDGAD